ncbi:MAG TPA: outer membrane protein assembly factor BamD [Pyrinomonadaceae bacterium]
MFSRRRLVFILILMALLYFPGSSSRAQKTFADGGPPPSEEELLRKADEDIQLLKQNLVRNRTDVLKRAEKLLKDILRLYPDTPHHGWVEDNLAQVQENLAEHNLLVANFYVNRAARAGAAKGAQSRLLEIVREYPNFSRMDEVLFFLGEVSLIDGRSEDASGYFWKLVCKYPASQRVGDAFVQLNLIGFDASKGCDNSNRK